MSSPSGTFTNQYGPWALIAGASEGIGESFAEELASKGLNLVLVARREKLLENIAKRLKQKFKIEVMVFPLDLNSEDMLEQVKLKTDQLDIGLLVYNAALSPIGLFTNHSLDIHLKVLNLNCKGSLSLTHYFSQKMKDKGRGGIILMTSMAGMHGSPIHTHYGATRAYVLHLAESLWYEMKDHNVHVMACAAGVTNTPNLLSSEPTKGLLIPKAMEPRKVAKAAIKGLVKNKPRIIPGFSNNLIIWFVHSFLPSKTRTRIMGSIAKKMYGEDKIHINK
ncbi:MAG: SDR family NAD(P)-dependent oxidoreductase [Candidatus Bathyarchaeota archaeon]|nr:SDR family NAD(P)-dependent oxidoreductase [Candidatus Bathyarchaeota archaeon]